MEELRLTTLDERRHRVDMIQVYKIVTAKDKVNSASWFKMAVDAPVQTGMWPVSINIVKPRARFDVRANFFSVRICDRWNGVPEEIKMARTTGQFKQLYKTHQKNWSRQ